MKWLAAAMLGLAAGLLGLVIGGLATARIILSGRNSYECGSPCFFATEGLGYGPLLGGLVGAILFAGIAFFLIARRFTNQV
jgi:hypothetical protein